MAFNYFNAYNRNAANKTSSHEIKYSEMVTMIEKDQVDEVLFKDSTIYITPVDGYVYTEEVTSGGKTETKTYKQSEDSSLTLYTAYLSNADLLPLMKEHNVAYTGFYEAEMSPFLMIKMCIRDSVGEAARLVGISRSAFYKYKDAVQPFQNMHAGHIITFYALLKDNPGVLSNYLSIFANSGANILTINQTIPTNGCAGVTISAETGDMSEELDDLMTRAAAADGVLKFEIMAG